MRIDKILIPLGAVIALSGFITSPVALLAGVIIAIAAGNPYSDHTKKTATFLMAIAIVGLGAGIPLNDILQVGAHGIVYTVIGIGFTFAAGLLLGKCCSIPKDTSLLITAGTAICGGSAIAAISRVIDAKSETTAIALGTVFLLNAAALLIFPFIGHALDLTQTQFGLWAGLAIHDTSSVVGAGIEYGNEAVKIATTTKLARVIWIIPLAFVIGLTWRRGSEGSVPLKAIIKRCWFIGGFLIMALLTTYSPQFQGIAPMIEGAAKRIMILVLFLIGAGMTRELLKSVGLKPFLQGLSLWIIVSMATLGAILAELIVL